MITRMQKWGLSWSRTKLKQKTEEREAWRGKEKGEVDREGDLENRWDEDTKEKEEKSLMSLSLKWGTPSHKHTFHFFSLLALRLGPLGNVLYWGGLHSAAPQKGWMDGRISDDCHACEAKSAPSLNWAFSLCLLFFFVQLLLSWIDVWTSYSKLLVVYDIRTTDKNSDPNQFKFG